MAEDKTLTINDVDQLLMDSEVLKAVMVAIARPLRVRYGAEWLLNFTMPGALTEDDMTAAEQSVMEEMAALADQGKVPAVDVLRGAMGEWLRRLFKSREAQWQRLSEATERVASDVRQQSSGKREGGSQTASLFMPEENRAAVVEAVFRNIFDYLNLERLAATEKEIWPLAEGLVNENLGAGVLEDYLRDESLSEIMVGRGGHIWVERNGRLIDTGTSVPEKRAMWFAQRLATLIGSRVDAASPSMDGFLDDGSRVHILISPIAMDGVCITIRRHAKRPTLEQLLAWGALTEELADFLRCAVAGRANILISGGTSSGKTSLLNVVAGFIPPEERVITMEDSPELRLPLPHVIRLRTRQANIEGKNAFPMGQLVIESLRMRPDRLVVGEVRGAEALYMIEAFNTGHDGGISTAHANSPLDMLKRLTVMMKRGDSTLDDRAAYELIASSIHLIVHASRRVINDKVVRGVDEVVEVVEYDPSRPGTLGFKLNRLFLRNEKTRQLERVGTLSERLAMHLRLNGQDVSRWT